MNMVSERAQTRLHKSAWMRSASVLAGVAVVLGIGAGGTREQAAASMPALPAFQEMCTADAMQAAASSLAVTSVTVKAIENGPFKSATQYVPAAGNLPAYCQVTGNFVTNPKTGKTANFLATFPANWNGKYLQLGCSGHCGQFYVSNPAMPSVTVTAQGHAGQIIEKGYATFATDEGHVGMAAASWAVRKDGTVDQDFLDDFYYRADLVLADMGKAFTTAFYASAKGAPQKIARSYFNGCSGGGRDAMVAASYFPEKFDGIIGGSPYDMFGMGIHASGVSQTAARAPGSIASPAHYALMDRLVKKQCDAVDGVTDGVIQNPAACNFRPDRDLPRCEGDKPGAQCFTKAQVDTISAAVSAVTDEKGNVLQPGYSVSELQPPSGMDALGDPVRKVFVYRNDPAFKASTGFSFREGGPGAVNAFHTVYASTEAAKVMAAIRKGEGHILANTGPLMRGNTKFMIWHNFSDEKLTPMSSVNYYKQLARRNGGYANVQKRVRLFMLPGTAHCSITGVAPNGFDALTTMEDWVERGRAPQSLRLTVANRQFSPGASGGEIMKTPNWTATVCKFPEMARYSGKGDVRDAANWSCSPKDTRLLQVGESGRQAGVLR